MLYKLLNGLVLVLFSIMVFLTLVLVYLSLPVSIQEAIPMPGFFAGFMTSVVVWVGYGLVRKPQCPLDQSE